MRKEDLVLEELEIIENESGPGHQMENFKIFSPENPSKNIFN